MSRSDSNVETTATGSEHALAPLDGALNVPTLTVVFGPAPERWGERSHPGSTPFPLDRVSEVFPGGPLSDPELSRRHAEVAPDGTGGFVVRDLGSKNGTSLNGVFLAQEIQPLHSRDVLRVGDTLLLFQATRCPPPADAAVPGFLGTSDPAREVRATISRLARRPMPTLVLGESGTGKELAASALAALGRSGRPFVAFNAAALPQTLVDSTLFGHVRGAFTDAREARPGLFRAAHGGTLFLDEAGELPPETQARLLRVLEERQVLPIGATEPVPIDVRVVAATNRDLPAEVAAGRFRADLYGRLACLEIRMPPLRDRREDIPLLAGHFAVAAGGPGTRFTAQAMTLLMLHPWPLNARELRSVVEQTVADRGRPGPMELPPSVLARLEEHRRRFVPGAGGAPRSEPATRHDPGPVAPETLEAALVRHHGNMTHVANELGKDRAQLYRLARRLGLEPERYR